jgi:alpha/beta superfamily hydrolase
MHKVQTVFFAGPVGQLEGLLKLTEGQAPRALVVICHPHPLYHGTMHNKVTFALADAYFKLGCIVLRFNFRGVGLSTGIHDHGKGEIDDAQSAIGYLRERYPGLGCHVAGFSFGAWIALEVARRESALISVCAVAPPFKYFDSDFLGQLTTPKLFLQGKADTICDGEELHKRFPSLADPKEVIWFEEADHFFAHRLEDLKKAIASRQHFLRL